MRQLVIDTATEALSVALLTDGELIDFHHEIAGRGHAEKLIPIIASLPDGGRAEEIIVDRGPGSFTGVRVGLAAARALGYAWDAPVKGYASLSLIAAMARDHGGAAEILTIAMTGGHGELFWQNFDTATLAPRSKITSTPITELAKTLDSPILYGTGAQALVEARGFGEAISIHPDARAFPKLAATMIETDVLPLYGRGADAVPLAERGSKS